MADLDKFQSLLRIIPAEVFQYMFPGQSLEGARATLLGEEQLENVSFSMINADVKCCIDGDLEETRERKKAKAPRHRLFPKKSIAFEAALPCMVEKMEEPPVMPEEESELDDEKTRAILDAIERIQKEYGITIEEFEMFLSYKVKPGRLNISRSGVITLPDFEDREVKMDTLSKVVFILFLRHPEGIEFKDIADYKDEMMSIYGHISNRRDVQGIRESIDRLCNTVENNSLNEKVSRIKRAFTNAMDERIAQFYYIKGPAGGIRKIDLDRNLVSM